MCGQSELQDEYEVDSSVDASQDRILTNVEAPYGLTLRVDRVGQRVTYGNDVVPGETVRFNYEGGSDEGAERNVLVVKVDDEGFEGLTLERDGDYRRYSDDHIDGLLNILIVEPFVKGESNGNLTEKRIRFDEAGDALLASLSGEALAALYLTHVALRGDSATFDENSGEVVIKLPEPKVNKFIQGDSHHSFTVLNKNGDKLRLFYFNDPDEVVGFDKILNDGTSVNIPSSDWTPEKLRDELVKFLA